MTAPPRFRPRHGRRSLAALVLLALALLTAFSRTPGADVEVRWPDAGDDLLVVQPRAGLEASALGAALADRGYRVLGTSGLDAVRVALAGSTTPRAIAAAIAGSGLARSVEPDVIVSAARLPDDPLYDRQAPYLAAVGAPEAWERAVGRPAVLVAIVDSGIDLDHPDLAPRIAINPGDALINGRDDDGNGCPDDLRGCSFVSLETADPSCDYRVAPPHRFVDDDEGHGSFVAGVAGAAGDNARGVSGVAWNIGLLPVKVLDCTATGRISDAAAGIHYAVRRGADVINVSFGSRTDSPVLRDAVMTALAAGVSVVASAGNEGVQLVTFPAAYPGVIAVAASGRVLGGEVDYRLPAVFTNFGSGVDLLAPGLFLTSTLPQQACGQRGWFCIDDELPYATASGTSFAAPLVAGAAALVRSDRPDIGPALVRAQLVRSAAPAAGPVGLLDAAGALTRPLFQTGAPGSSRSDPGGSPPAGPADPPAGPPPPIATRVPFPAETGHGSAPRCRVHAAQPSIASRRRASPRSS